MYKRHRRELLKTAQVKSKSWFSSEISTKPPFGNAHQYPQSQPLLASMATKAVRDYFLLQASLGLYAATLAEFQTEFTSKSGQKLRTVEYTIPVPICTPAYPHPQQREYFWLNSH